MVLCWSTLWKQKVQKGNDLRLELPQIQPGLLGGVCSGAFWRRALPVRSMKRSNKALDADGSNLLRHDSPADLPGHIPIESMYARYGNINH